MFTSIQSAMSCQYTSSEEKPGVVAVSRQSRGRELAYTATGSFHFLFFYIYLLLFPCSSISKFLHFLPSFLFYLFKNIHLMIWNLRSCCSSWWFWFLFFESSVLLFIRKRGSNLIYILIVIYKKQGADYRYKIFYRCFVNDNRSYGGA